jgi:hypothetical protein
VDAAHVERDIRDHVEGELADMVEPVTPERLEYVLERLGSPAQWVPQSVVCLSGEQGHTRAERWLFYPPLLCVYVPAVAFFLIRSSVPMGTWVFDELEDLYRYKLVVAGIRGEMALAVLSCYAAAAITGIWWMAAGRLGWRWPRLFALLLAPFATADHAKRFGKSLFFAGLGLLVVAGGVLAYVLATRPIATILVGQ